MSTVTYEVVEHDGGWAYKVDGSFSETFPTHAKAHAAALKAAGEHRVPDETAGIIYQDKSGAVHEEVDSGDDRPATTVVDKD